MDSYSILVYILFTLACIDLIVGVSNDAVNFLNSAIGSKVAPIRTILIIASLGILAGTLFSAGMMEVARKGIFNPGFFTFDMIMMLFLSVMLTDIILLDIYNSLGLPTSTTVSLVFELLGAAFSIGLLISYQQGNGFEQLSSILNYSSAITIVSGIFLSVFVSFIFGTIIQFGVRYLLTFNYETNLKRYGSVFSGVAITAITYFLILQGLKGSALVSSEQVEWVVAHTWQILLASMVFWSIVVQMLMWYANLNPLKMIVLMGTFSLAMAFASNDLVNFIGVAVAGFISYTKWSVSGIAASDFNMASLADKVETPVYMLVIAGIIMTVTLWVSAKAKRVTETEVSLGSQDEGDENFKANIISRFLVGSAMFISRGLSTVLPDSFVKKASKRFSKENVTTAVIDEADKPSFDLLRASVNLVVASILIAYATSQKLPLSTTYVTFMVAMSTALADRAWGRDSAVYRVAGVVNVIASWLLTAIVAFLGSALLGFILFHTGIAGVLVLSTLAIFLLVRSHILFKNKEKARAELKGLYSGKAANAGLAIEESLENTTKNLRTVRKVTALSIKSLIGENRDVLVRVKQEINRLREQNEKLQSKIIKYVKKMEKGQIAAGRLHILVFDLMQDIYQSTELVSEACTQHIVNHHQLPDRKYLDTLIELEKKLSKYIEAVVDSIGSHNYSNYQIVVEMRNKLIDYIGSELDNQINEIQSSDISSRSGMLQVKLLLESRDIVTSIAKVHAIFHDYSLTSKKEGKGIATPK